MFLVYVKDFENEEKDDDSSKFSFFSNRLSDFNFENETDFCSDSFD